MISPADTINRINRHQNEIGQSTSIILESATVGDKGSTTLGMRNSACVVMFVEPVSRSDAIFDSLAIPAKQVSESGMIKNQSKLNVNVSGIGRFFKRL